MDIRDHKAMAVMLHQLADLVGDGKVMLYEYEWEMDTRPHFSAWGPSITEQIQRRVVLKFVGPPVIMEQTINHPPLLEDRRKKAISRRS